MNRERLWAIGRNQMSTWLPALMMMLFALGTWWLVRSAPKIPIPNGTKAVSQEPDYFMREFAVRSFDATGRMTSELIGSEGHHYPATDTLEVTQPRLRSFDELGRPTVATARRGVSNADGSEVKLYDDAVVVREAAPKAGGGETPRLQFRGDYLHAFVNEDRVQSDQPVELMRGEDRFTGDSFSYDKRSGVANLTGRVRGVIQPKK